MRLHLMLEPQEGLSYDDILAVAQRVEATGLDGCYRSDHYTSVAGRPPLPSTDAWATLAGLARQTAGICIGTLVTPATFRRVGNLVKVVGTVAEMAGPAPDGGPRVHLGMGTGWLEEEHRQLGFPFEDLDTRFRRLSEHLEVVTRLWQPGAEPVEFAGEFVQLSGTRLRPIPDPRPRVIVGGTGLRRTPRLAARYADELNGVFFSPQRCAEQRAALDAACEQAGREPASVAYSLMTGCLVGASEAEFRARARRVYEVSGDGDFATWLHGLQDAWVLGAPEQAAERLGRLADAGVEAVMLQHQLPGELDMIDVIAEDVRSRL